MGKNNRAAATAKAAEMRAQAARQERQRKQLMAAVVAIVVVIGAVVVGVVVSNQKQPAQAGGTVSGAFLQKLGEIPEAALDKAGVTDVPNAVPAKIDGGAPLMDGDKPELVYVGAEFCPFCASERWALVAALERFGSFTGLAPTRSAENDGNIPTVTFKDAKYTSDHLSFRAIETQDREGKPLQQMPADISEQFAKHNPGGGIPWTFYGTHATSGSGVPLDPFSNYLGTDGWTKIVDQMVAGTGEVGKPIDANANMITAQLCQLTKGQPSNVCTSQAVMASTALLKK